MVAMVLGFGGRMGRLAYFLWSLGLAAVLTALTMVLILGALGGGAASRCWACCWWWCRWESGAIRR